jgi:hypothetical protein
MVAADACSALHPKADIATAVVAESASVGFVHKADCEVSYITTESDGPQSYDGDKVIAAMQQPRVAILILIRRPKALTKANLFVSCRRGKLKRMRVDYGTNIPNKSIRLHG